MPKKREYPLTLDAALRLWLPKIKDPDRHALYREYLAQSLHYDGLNAPNTVPERATKDEIDAVITYKRRGWFNEARFQTATRSFTHWLIHHSAKVRREKSRKGGLAKAVIAKQKAIDSTKPTKNRD
jgi:hypothetical protein